LLRIAHNRALNVLARRRALTLDPADEPEGKEPAGLERSPAESLELRERRERLVRKLDELRPVHRSVLVLRDLEGMSYEQIAQLTGSPLGSVKGRLHRARRELIELLRRNTYDWELPNGS
jgi:RNA polymerase sigma-70 factor, ECF subfamily